MTKGEEKSFLFEKEQINKLRKDFSESNYNLELI